MSTPSNPFLDHAAALESLLCDLLTAHQALLDVSNLQREAVRSADPLRVRNASDRQMAVLAEIATLEERRRSLVNTMLSLGGIRKISGTGPITLTDIAHQMPEPARTRLVELARDVRIAVEKAADQQRTLRAATASLLAHMEGLMRQVAQRLSHAGTYGRRGLIESVPAVISGLDLVT